MSLRSSLSFAAMQPALQRAGGSRLTVGHGTGLGGPSVGALEPGIRRFTVRGPGGQGGTQNLAHLPERKLVKAGLPGELEQVMRGLLRDRSQVSEGRPWRSIKEIWWARAYFWASSVNPLTERARNGSVAA